MTKYDPDTTPPPADWLDLDEGERIILVEEYHRRHGITHPQLKLHSTIHTVVENQIALREPEVLEALDRLQADGLTRHDAIHALGQVVVEHMVETFKSKSSETAATVTPYAERVQRLTADDWRRSGDAVEDEVMPPVGDSD